MMYSVPLNEKGKVLLIFPEEPVNPPTILLTVNIPYPQSFPKLKVSLLFFSSQMVEVFELFLKYSRIA